MTHRQKWIFVGALLVLLCSCSALFREVGTKYIWSHWGRIHSIRAEGDVSIAGFPDPMQVKLYYLKPERIRISFDSPARLAGSVLAFNQGTFVAYNTIDESALIVRGVPLFKPKEKHELVKNFLTKGYGQTSFQKVGVEDVAGKQAHKYQLSIQHPSPHIQWIWLDPNYLFPLKAVFQDPYTHLISTAAVRHITYNEFVDPKVFGVEIPQGVRRLDFDLSKIQKQERPLFPTLPVPFQYLGSVSDKNGSEWIFSDYSTRPSILYTLHASNPRVRLPLTGFVQKYEVKGEARYSIPIRGYSLIYYRKGDLQVMLMSNTSYEELLAISLE